MNWLRLLVGVIQWATPAALVVAAVASRDLQRRVLPVFAALILLMTVAAVYRYWPRRDA